jgi:hypothetical protein
MILETFEFARGIGLAVVAILVATFHGRAVEGHGLWEPDIAPRQVPYFRELRG